MGHPVYEVCAKSIRPAFISSPRALDWPLRGMNVTSSPSRTP